MSRLCHLSFLVLLTSLFTSTRGHTENVTEHLTIKKQGAGPLAMSSVKGESQESFTDWQLDMDLIKILEGSERRLEFSGILNDGVTNRTAECSSSKSDVIEKTRKLLRILCPKEGDKDFKLIPRSVWAEVNGESGSQTSEDKDLFFIYRRESEDLKSTALRITKQAELLLVSVHFPFASNFYIENDGRIFEGLGWNNVSYVYSGGLGDRALMIVFVDRRLPNLTPSEAAVRAYESLVRYAICTGRLSTDYLLIPYHLIWDSVFTEGWRDPESADYESNQMSEWNAYTDNVDFLFPPENDVDQVLHVVSREEWKGVRTNSSFSAMDDPVSRVVVTSYGPRCFRDCGKYLKLMEENLERQEMHEFYLPFNFIITESGRVYEGFGWNHASNVAANKISVVILFLGTFDNYSPRRRAFIALNKIIEEGLRNGKIIPDYQITDHILGDILGKGLHQEIRKMDRFKP